MSLSKRSVETLIDLVEIKLSCIEVYDREDDRERRTLEQCLKELKSLQAPEPGASDGRLVRFPQTRSDVAG